MSVDIAEMIGTAVAICGLFGALFTWSIRVVLAPVKVSIDNNTKVIERITEKLDAHDDRLDDHSSRLTKIETQHKMHHGD